VKPRCDEFEHLGRRRLRNIADAIDAYRDSAAIGTWAGPDAKTLSTLPVLLNITAREAAT
jgi:hypothetical protein